MGRSQVLYNRSKARLRAGRGGGRGRGGRDGGGTIAEGTTTTTAPQHTTVSSSAAATAHKQQSTTTTTTPLHHQQQQQQKGVTATSAASKITTRIHRQSQQQLQQQRNSIANARRGVAAAAAGEQEENNNKDPSAGKATSSSSRLDDHLSKTNKDNEWDRHNNYNNTYDDNADDHHIFDTVSVATRELEEELLQLLESKASAVAYMGTLEQRQQQHYNKSTHMEEEEEVEQDESTNSSSLRFATDSIMLASQMAITLKRLSLSIQYQIPSYLIDTIQISVPPEQLVNYHHHQQQQSNHETNPKPASQQQQQPTSNSTEMNSGDHVGYSATTTTITIDADAAAAADRSNVSSLSSLSSTVADTQQHQQPQQEKLVGWASPKTGHATSSGGIGGHGLPPLHPNDNQWGRKLAGIVASESSSIPIEHREDNNTISNSIASSSEQQSSIVTSAAIMTKSTSSSSMWWLSQVGGDSNDPIILLDDDIDLFDQQQHGDNHYSKTDRVYHPIANTATTTAATANNGIVDNDPFVQLRQNDYNDNVQVRRNFNNESNNNDNNDNDNRLSTNNTNDDPWSSSRTSKTKTSSRTISGRQQHHDRNIVHNSDSTQQQHSSSQPNYNDSIQPDGHHHHDPALVHFATTPHQPHHSFNDMNRIQEGQQHHHHHRQHLDRKLDLGATSAISTNPLLQHQSSPITDPWIRSIAPSSMSTASSLTPSNETSFGLIKDVQSSSHFNSQPMLAPLMLNASHSSSLSSSTATSMRYPSQPVSSSLFVSSNLVDESRSNMSEVEESVSGPSLLTTSIQLAHTNYPMQEHHQQQLLNNKTLDDMKTAAVIPSGAFAFTSSASATNDSSSPNYGFSYLPSQIGSSVAVQGSYPSIGPYQLSSEISSSAGAIQDDAHTTATRQPYTGPSSTFVNIPGHPVQSMVSLLPPTYPASIAQSHDAAYRSHVPYSTNMVSKTPSHATSLFKGSVNSTSPAVVALSSPLAFGLSSNPILGVHADHKSRTMVESSVPLMMGPVNDTVPTILVRVDPEGIEEPHFQSMAAMSNSYSSSSPDIAQSDTRVESTTTTKMNDGWGSFAMANSPLTTPISVSSSSNGPTSPQAVQHENATQTGQQYQSGSVALSSGFGTMAWSNVVQMGTSVTTLFDSIHQRPSNHQTSSTVGKGSSTNTVHQQHDNDEVDDMDQWLDDALMTFDGSEGQSHIQPRSGGDDNVDGMQDWLDGVTNVQ